MTGEGFWSAAGGDSEITVRKNSGSDVGTRPRLNFIEGSNVTLTVADDSGDDEVDVTIAASGGGSGATTAIAQTVLGSAAANIDFSSIPSTYEHLILVVVARTTQSALSNLVIRFNNDSGNNYNYNRNIVNSGGASHATGTSQSAAEVGFVPGSGASAGQFGMHEIFIARYAGTATRKQAISKIAVESSGSRFTGVYQGIWGDTSAINRITILTSAGANLDTGSMATLYGLAGP